MGRLDQLLQFLKGPVWAGNLISCSNTDSLYKLGYVFRINGWTSLTKQGIKVLDDLGLIRK